MVTPSESAPAAEARTAVLCAMFGADAAAHQEDAGQDDVLQPPRVLAVAERHRPPQRRPCWAAEVLPAGQRRER